MRKFILITGCTLAIFALNFLLEASEGGEVYYDISNLSSQDIQECFAHGSSSVLVCPAGSALPLTLFLNGALVELESGEAANLRLKVKETLYFRWRHEQIEMSFDGSLWGSIEEMTTGLLSIQLSADEGIPQLRLDGEFHRR